MQTGTYTNRNVRADARQARLKGLGYPTYAAYLSSPAWRQVKRRYYEECSASCMCGETQALQLHHTTYDRVGQERIEDLIALCSKCHQQVHVLEAAGVIGLDLAGFYYDVGRAAANAPIEAARKAAAERDHVRNDHLRKGGSPRLFDEYRTLRRQSRVYQLRAASGQRKGACHDIQRARIIEHVRATTLVRAALLKAHRLAA